MNNPGHAAQDVLMQESEEFQQLFQRHRELDERLSALGEQLILER